MAATALQKQFKNVFEENGIEVEDADTLQEVVLMAFKKGATAAQIADGYEAYCLNFGMDSSTMSKSHLEGFERHMMEQRQSVVKAEPVTASLNLGKKGGTTAARLGLFKPDPSTPSPTSSLHKFPSPGMGGSPDAAMEPLSLDDMPMGEEGAPGLATRTGVLSLNSRRSTAPSPFQQRLNRLRVVSSYVGTKTPRGFTQKKPPPVPSQAHNAQSTAQSVKAEQHAAPLPAPSAGQAAAPVKVEPIVKEEPMEADGADISREKDAGSSAVGNSSATGTAPDTRGSKDVDMGEEAQEERSAASVNPEAQEQVKPAVSAEASPGEEAGATLAGDKGAGETARGPDTETAVGSGEGTVEGKPEQGARASPEEENGSKLAEEKAEEAGAKLAGETAEEAGTQSAGEKGEEAPAEGSSAELAAANANSMEEGRGARSEPESAVQGATAAQEEAASAQEGGGGAQSEGTEAQDMETGAEEKADTGAAGAVKTLPAGKGKGKAGDSQDEDMAGELGCVPAEAAARASRGRCAVQPLEVAKLREGCRFMADSAETRWRELNNRFERFICALQAADPSFNPTQLNLYASQGLKSAVGRICCDSEDSSGPCRLNPGSILLEGCLRPGCDGIRVKLDVSDVPEFSLFPGQIVLVEGENPSGRYFKASRLRTLLHPPFPAPDVSPEEPAEKRTRRGHAGSSKWRPSQAQPMTMVVAAGPYTASDNWGYEPLEALLEYAQGVAPDVLLLLGPFVDSEHPDVQQGVVEEPFEDIFREHVLKRVQRTQQSNPRFTRTRVVVQPALRDAMHQSVFPQPPMGRELMGEAEAAGAVSLANPSFFTCDDQVTVACTTVDILRHLSSEETARAGKGTGIDRMSRLALHLLGQRSFYPLFPPALGTCLDTSLAPQALQMPLTPHLLFLPSDLAPFAKALPLDDACAKEVKSQETGKEDMQQQNQEGQQQGEGKKSTGQLPFRPLCINPGRLTKGPGGGTFCRVSVYSSDNESFHEYVQVDVMRI